MKSVYEVRVYYVDVIEDDEYPHDIHAVERTISEQTFPTSEQASTWAFAEWERAQQQMPDVEVEYEVHSARVYGGVQSCG